LRACRRSSARRTALVAPARKAATASPRASARRSRTPPHSPKRQSTPRIRCAAAELTIGKPRLLSHRLGSACGLIARRVTLTCEPVREKADSAATDEEPETGLRRWGSEAEGLGPCEQASSQRRRQRKLACRIAQIHRITCCVDIPVPLPRILELVERVDLAPAVVGRVPYPLIARAGAPASEQAPASSGRLGDRRCVVAVSIRAAAGRARASRWGAR